MCVLVCVSHRILKSEHSLLIAGNGENVSRILAQPNDSLHIDSIRSILWDREYHPLFIVFRRDW